MELEINFCRMLQPVLLQLAVWAWTGVGTETFAVCGPGR